MSPLKLYTVNTKVSRRSIVATLVMVEFNHDVDKSFVAEEYYSSALIEVSSIRRSKCKLLLFDSETEKLYCYREKFDLSFLPKNLIKHAKRSGYKYIHVLIRKKMFFNSMMETMQITMIVPIGRNCIGYPSNEEVIERSGEILLNSFYNNKEEAWKNIPLPRYDTLLKIVRFKNRLLFPMMKSLKTCYRTAG
jgi:hypothetical protein